MTEETCEERGLRELNAQDPECADAVVFGRVAHPDRRGFTSLEALRPLSEDQPARLSAVVS